MVSASDLMWRPAEDGSVLVYQCQSGDTHILNHLAATALQRIRESPLTAAEWTAAMCHDFEQLTEDETAQEMDNLIRLFDDLGLIEPCP